MSVTASDMGIINLRSHVVLFHEAGNALRIQSMSFLISFITPAKMRIIIEK